MTKIKDRKETVGKVARDLMMKAPDTRSPIELEREMQKEYLEELHACIANFKQTHACDFFVVVITKNEPTMRNVFRNYFFGRLSCPTPDYDQTVWKYHYVGDRLEYIWTIPSRDVCYHLKDNALRVAKNEKDLLNFVLEFADGTLYTRCKQLNGEKEHSNEIERD